MLKNKYLFVGIDPSFTTKKLNTNHNGIAFIESNSLTDLTDANFYVDVLASTINNFNSEYEYLMYVFDSLINTITSFLNKHGNYDYIFIGIEEFTNQRNLSKYNPGTYTIDTGTLVDKFIYEAKSLILKKTNLNVNIYKCLRREAKYFTNQYLTKMGYIYLYKNKYHPKKKIIIIFMNRLILLYIDKML